MKRIFHDAGLCVAHKHYMVDTTHKIEQVIDLIEMGNYFTMNRPRQFGKTTTLTLLWRELLTREQYLVVRLSFEGIGDDIFRDAIVFCKYFVDAFNYELKKTYPTQELLIPKDFEADKNGFDKLALQINGFVEKSGKQIVLLIDEVDKSTNNQLFLHFLGMLRDMYLKRDDGSIYTFQAVILVGIHDVKTIKLKLRPDEERKFNSPWNIAIDFTVDLSFKAKEIETMLVDYAQDKQVIMDVPKIAERIYFYTSGYPFLVSKMCKVIDELLLPAKENKKVWEIIYVEEAFKYLTKGNYTTTIFDDLFKNIEHNPDLYDFVIEVVINGVSKTNNQNNPTIALATIYGIIDLVSENCKIHNRIFEQRIYNYLLSKIETSGKKTINPYLEGLVENKQLIMPNIMRKFQEFMRENYSPTDTNFLEREGRLIFLSFLKPIINGKGFDFKEPNTSEERRMDIVITFNQQRLVIELKIWRGESYHQDGLQQLSDYLDIYGLEVGYLLIFNFNKNKEYKEQTIQFKGKEIFAVWV